MVNRCARIFKQLMRHFPAGNLHLAAPDVLIQRNIVFFNQVGSIALDEPGHIFSKMLAGFGDKISQALEHIKPHPVPIRDPTFRNHLAEQRVQVLSIPLKMQVKRQVVDPGAQIINFFQRHIDQFSQLCGGALHRMTQTHRADL